MRTKTLNIMLIFLIWLLSLLIMAGVAVDMTKSVVEKACSHLPSSSAGLGLEMGSLSPDNFRKDESRR